MTIKYGLSEPFDVEDGSLEGLSREECFVLGVEWQLFRQALEGGKPLTKLVRIPNADRLSKMAQRHGRRVDWKPVSDEWAEMHIDEAPEG